jgi:hypothetical protein
MVENYNQKILLHRRQNTASGPAGTQRGDEQPGIPVVILNPEEVSSGNHGGGSAPNSPLSSTVTVLNTATPLPASVLTNRKTVMLYNTDQKTMYIGGSGVTVANGFPVPSGEFTFPYPVNESPLYGIYATGSGDVRVLEIG